MMSQRTIPTEIAKSIVRSTDRRSLPVLARTSRSLQSEAEKRLYEVIEVLHSPIAREVCHTLATCPRVAAYVRTFILAVVIGRSRDHERDQAFYIVQQAVSSRDYWEVVRKALENLRALDYLFLSDPRFRNSWVVHPTDNWTLRAREIRLYFSWDENIAKFIETQSELRVLTIAEVAENVPVAKLASGAVPNLTHFEGPPILLYQLLHCPITHLKIPTDNEDAISLLPIVLPELYRFRKLHSLNIVPFPHDLLLSSMVSIAAACPNLRYLAYIPLPMEHKSRITLLQHLSHLHELAYLEVDISHWLPFPVGNYQRIFAVELRMALPSVRRIAFYYKADRYTWMWDNDNVEVVQHQLDTLSSNKEAGSFGDEEEAPYVIGLEGWHYQCSPSHWPAHSYTWRGII